MISLEWILLSVFILIIVSFLIYAFVLLIKKRKKNKQIKLNNKVKVIDEVIITHTDESI